MSESEYNHNFVKLRNHILGLSQSDNWDNAKHEWKLVRVEIHNNLACNCPCGQAINELCYLENEFTKAETYVGNVCVNRFLEIDTGNLFDGLKRILKDTANHPNDDVIDYAAENGYLHETELKFLYSIQKKRNLSEKQTAWLKKINWRIINKVTVK